MESQINALFAHIEADYDKWGSKFPINLSYTEGRKYIRVVRDGSAWGFIDKNTGLIYKAASWAAPAKHARGDINDATTWSEFRWTGPQYLL